MDKRRAEISHCNRVSRGRLRERESGFGDPKSSRPDLVLRKSPRTLLSWSFERIQINFESSQRCERGPLSGKRKSGERYQYWYLIFPLGEGHDSISKVWGAGPRGTDLFVNARCFIHSISFAGTGKGTMWHFPSCRPLLYAQGRPHPFSPLSNTINSGSSIRIDPRALPRLLHPDINHSKPPSF